MTSRGLRKNHPSEYESWHGMICRCKNPHHTSYAIYGGRGIVVCERWKKSFSAFLEDMGPRPTPGHSIDRIDNDGNYEPGNCRWATRQQQQRNRRANRLITLDGKTQCLTAWANEFAISVPALRFRLRAIGEGKTMKYGGEKLPAGARSSRFSRSSTGFKGVYRYKHRFLAQVATRQNGKRTLFRLGSFDSAIEAAKAYNAKASELFGEFARLNPV